MPAERATSTKVTGVMGCEPGHERRRAASTIPLRPQTQQIAPRNGRVMVTANQQTSIPPCTGEDCRHRENLNKEWLIPRHEENKD